MRIKAGPHNGPDGVFYDKKWDEIFVLVDAGLVTWPGDRKLYMYQNTQSAEPIKTQMMDMQHCVRLGALKGDS